MRSLTCVRSSRSGQVGVSVGWNCCGFFFFIDVNNLCFFDLFFSLRCKPRRLKQMWVLENKSHKFNIFCITSHISEGCEVPFTSPTARCLLPYTALRLCSLPDRFLRVVFDRWAKIAQGEGWKNLVDFFLTHPKVVEGGAVTNRQYFWRYSKRWALFSPNPQRIWKVFSPPTPWGHPCPATSQEGGVRWHHDPWTPEAGAAPETRSLTRLLTSSCCLWKAPCWMIALNLTLDP